MPQTKDHEFIKNWAKQYKAHPAIVRGTEALLRFDFEGDADDTEDKDQLLHIDWDEFFRIFDSRKIELLSDDDPKKRFFKFVHPQE